MEQYRKHDYAINKYHDGIVYRSNDDKLITITLEDYQRENPLKSENDFFILKTLSDEIYFNQDRSERRQAQKNVSIHNLEETKLCAVKSPEEIYIEQEERAQLFHAITKILNGNMLTKKQQIRFIKHYLQGESIRSIAKDEGIGHAHIVRSLQSVVKKLRRCYFDNDF